MGSTVMPVTHADSDDVEIQTESELEQASSTRNDRRAALANIIAAEVRVASGRHRHFIFPAQRKERGLPQRDCCK